MESGLSVLLVEDNPGDVRLIQELLAEAPPPKVALDLADRLATGLARVKQDDFSAILLDLSLPDSRGLATIVAMRAQAPSIPIIVLTGTDDEYIALSAVKAGAQDYLVKGKVSYDMLLRAMRYAIERKHAQESLWQANAALSSLVQASPLAIALVDTDPVPREWNAAAERIFGWPREEVIDRPVASMRKTQRELFSACVAAHGYAAADELRVVRDDGSEIDVNLWTAPITDAAGTVLSVVAILADVTERKRAADAMRFANERLQLLSRRILEIQEAERRVIARELHDEIGQDLTALKLQIDIMQRRAPNTAMKGSFAECDAMIDQTIEQVRRLSHSLRPGQLDDLGLASALRAHFERQARAAGLRLHFSVPQLDARLPGNIEIACYRVAQEALNNIIKHAHAGAVWLSLEQDPAQLTLQIRDDGRGFDVGEARHSAVRGGSFGMISMQERVELTGGHMNLTSAAGRGTELTAVFPLT